MSFGIIASAWLQPSRRVDRRRLPQSTLKHLSTDDQNRGPVDDSAATSGP
ncbi:hypothetical protein SynBIOSU31_02948 [Synechococcus sp. BIOS-U3-1]|nr:hypothetical protein SynBIOSU31_02948 [Synechococcus sp. BIOS-U3-1]